MGCCRFHVHKVKVRISFRTMEVKLKEPITGELLHALHDAEIFSIEVDRVVGSLRIGFIQTSGANSWLEFLGVVSFRLSDFVGQNVVSRVRATPWHSFAAGRLEELMAWSNSFSDTTIRPSSKSMERALRAIEEGRLTVVTIEPSRGAEAVIMAEGVFILGTEQGPVGGTEV